MTKGNAGSHISKGRVQVGSPTYVSNNGFQDILSVFRMRTLTMSQNSDSYIGRKIERVGNM